MSERSTYFFFILRHIDNIKLLEESIRYFLRDVTKDIDFQLVQYGFDEESNDQYPKYHPVEIDHFIDTEITKVDPGGMKNLVINFILNGNDDMDVTVSIDISKRMSLIRAGYIFFKEDTWCRALLRLCTIFQLAINPFYGYGIASPTDFPRTTDLHELAVSKLYTYNFFGEYLANYFNRNRLSGLPAWKSKDLKDKGFFLAVEENPFNKKDDIEATYREISNTLNLEVFQRSD